MDDLSAAVGCPRCKFPDPVGGVKEYSPGWVLCALCRADTYYGLSYRDGAIQCYIGNQLRRDLVTGRIIVEPT